MGLHNLPWPDCAFSGPATEMSRRFSQTLQSNTTPADEPTKDAGSSGGVVEDTTTCAITAGLALRIVCPATRRRARTPAMQHAGVHARLHNALGTSRMS